MHDGGANETGANLGKNRGNPAKSPEEIPEVIRAKQGQLSLLPTIAAIAAVLWVCLILIPAGLALGAMVVALVAGAIQ